MATGSCDEMRVWLRYALDLGYIDEATWQGWRDEYQMIVRMVQSLAGLSDPSSVVRLLSSDAVAERSVSR